MGSRTKAVRARRRPTAHVREPRAFASLSDLEAAASAKLNSRVWAYVQGGSGDERTLRWNVDAFARTSIRPRAWVDVSEVRLGTTLLGRAVSMPLFVAPMAYQREIHPEDERGVARAAGDAEVLAVYSTLSSASMEQIAGASPSAYRWFQLYLQPSFDESRVLVERAERGGFSALVVTVDCPVLGVRDRQAREGFAIDESVPVGNGPRVRTPSRAATLDGEVHRLRTETAATWSLLRDFSGITHLPIVVKGVLTAEDARHAVANGARGVVVSNHGGRQLDGVPASLEVLREVVREVGSEVEVYLDGGVRRGADVMVALAHGARAVGIGRPILWALATGGSSGVAWYFTLLRAELANVMALAGRRSVAEIDESLLRAVE